MKLLLDHNLSPRIARALQALFADDHSVVALRDKFSTNVTDHDWITALDAEGGWAVLTKDLRIRTRPHERAALDRSRIGLFFSVRLLEQMQHRRNDLAPNSTRSKDGNGRPILLSEAASISRSMPDRN